MKSPVSHNWPGLNRDFFRPWVDNWELTEALKNFPKHTISTTVVITIRNLPSKLMRINTILFLKSNCKRFFFNADFLSVSCFNYFDNNGQKSKICIKNPSFYKNCCVLTSKSVNWHWKCVFIHINWRIELIWTNFKKIG
jgi:hypothetical protein